MACHWEGNSLVLTCRVQPRSSADRIAVRDDGSLRIRIKASPVDGKANAHLVKFLAKQFAVPRGRVHIVRGERNREKRILIESPGDIAILQDLQPTPKGDRQE